MEKNSKPIDYLGGNCYNKVIDRIDSAFLEKEQKEQKKGDNFQDHEKEFFLNSKGEPVYLTGLQCHNSSVGTAEMEKTIQAIRLFGGNLLEAPVYWCELEPEKDRYDFDQLQGLLDLVNREKLYLIPLWFGASKNGMSTYAPEYVKRDPDTYRMAENALGFAVESLAPDCKATLERDKKAFEQMLAYLAEHDTEKRVIALQVENEMGLVRTDRDYSEAAEALYHAPVPEYLEKKGNWKHAYGRLSAEAFTAWTHARYVKELVENAGALFPVPYIMNISLELNEYEEPGHCYIAGGPVAKVLDIWKKTVPEIHLYGPDIYLQAERDYREACRRYTREDNPLFIPESCITGTGAGLNMMIAAGDYQAIGVCCFGAESAVSEGQLIPDALETASSMRMISSVAPLLIRFHRTGKIHTILQSEFSQWQYILAEKYHVTVHFTNCMEGQRNYFGSRINLFSPEHTAELKRRGKGLLFENGDEFYVVGCGLCIDFRKRPGENEERAYEYLRSDGASTFHFLSIEEGHFEDGEWICEYRRNGDESYGGVYVHEGSIVRIRFNPD